MIDVGDKKITKRQARASAFVRLNKEIMRKMKNNRLPKGNAFETSRIAGICAAKKTADIIPFCHNIGLDCVDINFNLKKDGVEILSEVKSTGKTGVEMEALTACAVAALTIYDMCKMFSQEIVIEKICLLEKRGGKSGAYKAENSG